MNKIQFDGAAIPNPGKMGIGAVLIKDGIIISEISKKLPGRGTNNIAEYTALLAGITEALDLGWSHVEIEGDSRLVINQVNGAWKINKNHLKKLCSQVKNELTKLDSYTISWIPRELNSVADGLASKAIGSIEDPYHSIRSSNNSKYQKHFKKNDVVADTRCPKCKGECVFKWQVFKNGSHHIRQECARQGCGYIRYAPKIEPFIALANSKKDNILQKKLFF